MRKTLYAICKHQRCRSACASAQSDQRIFCSLPRWYNTSSCYIRNFKTLAGLSLRAGRFVSYLVGNSEDRFSRDVACFILDVVLGVCVLFPILCHGQKMVFDCIGSGSLHFQLRFTVKIQDNFHLLTESRNQVGVVTHVALYFGEVFERGVGGWNTINLEIVNINRGDPEKDCSEFTHIVPSFVVSGQVLYQLVEVTNK